MSLSRETLPGKKSRRTCQSPTTSTAFLAGCLFEQCCSLCNNSSQSERLNLSSGRIYSTVDLANNCHEQSSSLSLAFEAAWTSCSMGKLGILSVVGGCQCAAHLDGRCRFVLRWSPTSISNYIPFNCAPQEGRGILKHSLAPCTYPHLLRAGRLTYDLPARTVDYQDAAPGVHLRLACSRNSSAAVVSNSLAMSSSSRAGGIPQPLAPLLCSARAPFIAHSRARFLSQRALSGNFNSSRDRIPWNGSGRIHHVSILGSKIRPFAALGYDGLAATPSMQRVRIQVSHFYTSI